MAEIIPYSQLPFKIEYLRSKNKDLKIVATNGCFDILHVGHVRSLQKAKTFGDMLVVGINSDKSIRTNKGDSRPINNESHRIEVIASLSCVDIVTIFDELTAEKFLELIKPDIYVKGSDYNLEDLPEAKLVRKYNGKVIGIPIVPNQSTTSVIDKIKQLQ